MSLILSLFPGIGLLDMAFEEEGFCIVRGPDLLWGGDIRRFHPPTGKFDGVIGGPPCQAFSRLRHLVEHNGYTVAETLIPEFERCVVEAAPSWFVMENVPAAPRPCVPGYAVTDTLITDAHVGGETSRQRRFSFGHRGGDARRLHVEFAALHRPDPERAICASGGYRHVPVACLAGGVRKRTKARDLGWKTAAAAAAEALRLQGLPADFLDDAPFTARGKNLVIGNGVPLPMGRAIAQAVKRAIAG